MTDKRLKDIVAELDDDVDDAPIQKTAKPLDDTAITIEHGVPIPKVSVNRTRIYPFAKMQKGDSFFLPLTQGDSFTKAVARVRAATTSWRSQGRKGERYVVRSVDGGVRCWRTE